MDKRIFSDGNVDIVLIRQNQLSDPHAPLVTELNTNGVNVSNAVAWDGTTWPSSTDSNMNDDRSIKDAGNAQSRGYAQFEATLNFFFPKDLADTTSDYGKTYQALKDAAARPGYYIVTRVLQTTTNKIDPFVAGDLVSVYKVGADAFITDTEGEDSYKYTINFLPQGDLAVYTQVVPATKAAIVATAAGGASTSIAVGGHVPLLATLQGKRYTNVVTWKSSNTAIATVSPNGVVTGVAAGTANITASHDAGTTSTEVGS